MNDRFKTSDGKVWIVKPSPDPPDWTPRQKAAAKRYIVFGVTVLAFLTIGLNLYMAVRLFGG